MQITKILIQIFLFGLLSMPAAAMDKYPLTQGVHEWPTFGGKLYLVVGTYQDSVVYRRTYNFYFKEANDDAWNQVHVLNKKGNRLSSWESAVGADVTIADGMVVSRRDGTYFVIADKQIKGDYNDKGTIFVTWHKLVHAEDDQSDDTAYQFKPVFARSYQKSELTIEELLMREIALSPKK